MLKKTIQISPELFKISGGKTRRNRDKKQLDIKPLVSPNNLKNKLLQQIKHHKTKELMENKTNKQHTQSQVSAQSQISNSNDEFTNAINYMSDFAKKQKSRQILNNKTVKNQFTSNTNLGAVNPNVLLDLPPELFPPENNNVENNNVFNVNYKTDDNVPYGCLKNGKKKTYREWKELTKQEQIPSLVRPPTPPKKNGFVEIDTNVSSVPQSTESMISREQRLEQIKTKLKRLQDQETVTKNKVLDDLAKIEKEINKKNNISLDELPNMGENVEDDTADEIHKMIAERERVTEAATPKQYLKKTVKRTFTLGKSEPLRKVGVLIKNTQTRKNIINTQKELKKTNINDVRKYLRQHGMVKVGSTCPPDILRKTFESALMAGEITNTNKETLLHNFLNHETSK
jgi:hypothetical protein